MAYLQVIALVKAAEKSITVTAVADRTDKVGELLHEYTVPKQYVTKQPVVIEGRTYVYVQGWWLRKTLGGVEQKQLCKFRVVPTEEVA
jgi:hypothetical protein